MPNPAYPGWPSISRRAVFQALRRQRWGIVLGSLLARSLDLGVGDQVEITLPKLNLTPLGNLPRRKRLSVVGIFEVGAQLDATHALVSLADGQALLAEGDTVHGLRLDYDDLFNAEQLSSRVAAAMPAGLRVTSWRESHRSLFSAVNMEKTVITVLLLAVVAVAAFNIVSTLTMAVTEKRSDIAVLRTMGASRATIMAIFVCQGMSLSLLGIFCGASAGILMALNIADISQFLEQLLGVKLFDPQVYFISRLPARLDPRDLGIIVVLALLLSTLATLVPARRASDIDPAEVLRHG